MFGCINVRRRNVDPTVCQRTILHSVRRTASLVKMFLKPLPEALGLILEGWEAGGGSLTGGVDPEEADISLFFTPVVCMCVYVQI